MATEKDAIVPPATNTIKEVEYEGFKFKFDSDKIDDVEVVEMAAKIEEGKPALIIDFIKLLVGDDGYTAMKDYFVEKDGKFRLTTLTNIFEVIFKQFDPKG